MTRQSAATSADVGGRAERGARPAVHRLLARPETGALVGAVLVYVFFAAVAGDSGFLTRAGTLNWLEVSAELGIIVIPATLGAGSRSRRGVGARRRALDGHRRPVSGNPARVEAGRLLFAVDQQQYLQGYLGGLSAVQFVRYGLQPPKFIPSGPALIRPEDAGQVIELSEESIR
jgi:hypothetical protein